MMAVFADDPTVVTVGIIVSGAFIGVNNTLITEAVMGAAPVERPVASAAYSFVRFTGGAVGPYVALKLFGRARPHVHAPFWFGAARGRVGVVILAAGARTVAAHDHRETARGAGRGRGGPGRRPRLSPTASRHGTAGPHLGAGGRASGGHLTLTVIVAMPTSRPGLTALVPNVCSAAAPRPARS